MRSELPSCKTRKSHNLAEGYYNHQNSTPLRARCALYTHYIIERCARVVRAAIISSFPRSVSQPECYARIQLRTPCLRSTQVPGFTCWKSYKNCKNITAVRHTYTACAFRHLATTRLAPHMSDTSNTRVVEYISQIRGICDSYHQ